MRRVLGFLGAAVALLSTGAVAFNLGDSTASDIAGILPTIVGLGFFLAAILFAGRWYLRRRASGLRQA